MTMLETPTGRYGAASTPGRRRRNVVILTVLGVLVVGLVAWLALGNQGQSVTYETYGYKVVDDQTVDVTLDVTVDKGTSVECTLEALNAQHAQVGSHDVTFGPSTSKATRYTVALQTSERAVTGNVDTCRITH
jgi:uncharacterized protein (DUF58 family)